MITLNLRDREFMPKSFEEHGNLFSRLARRANMNNYETHEPIYLYHVSPKPLGRGESDTKITLSPKVIRSSEDDIGHLQRICVAPSIEQCLIAITGNASNYFYVYRTLNKVNKSIIPYGVMDAAITQERWLGRSRRFELVAKIPAGFDHIHNKSGSAAVYYDFGSRGGIEDIETQRYELKRSRAFIKKYGSDFFVSEKEKKLYEEQRKIKLRLNRNDIKRVRSSSAS